MTLALTLCCAGCASGPRLSLHLGPLGNAVLATLPVGTILQLPAAEPARQMPAAFVNEVRIEDGRWKLRQPLKLCTPAYLAERDLRELEFLKQIESLRVENQNLRLK